MVELMLALVLVVVLVLVGLLALFVARIQAEAAAANKAVRNALARMTAVPIVPENIPGIDLDAPVTEEGKAAFQAYLEELGMDANVPHGFAVEDQAYVIADPTDESIPNPDPVDGAHRTAAGDMEPGAWAGGTFG